MTTSPQQRIEMRQRLSEAPPALRGVADDLDVLLPMLPRCDSPTCDCTAGGAAYLIMAIDRLIAALSADREILYAWWHDTVDTEGRRQPQPPI